MKIPIISHKKANKVKKLCEPIFIELGITYFGATRVYSNNTLAGLFSDMELPEFWMDNQFPIPGLTHTGLAIPSGLYAQNVIGELYPSYQRQLTKQFCQLDHILYAVVNHDNFADVFLLATTPKHERIYHHYMNKTDIIRRFIQYFYAEMHLAFQRIEDDRVILPAFENEEAIKNATIDKSADPLSHLQTTLLLKTSYNTFVKLTKRESECVELLAKGFSCHYISTVLGLSYRTIESYIDSVRNKLGITKRDDIVKIYYDSIDTILF